MKRLMFFLALGCLLQTGVWIAQAGTLSWNPSATWDDGSAMTSTERSLLTYNAYFGSSTNSWNFIGTTAGVSITCSTPPAGITWYYTVETVYSGGTPGVKSAPYAYTTPVPPPVPKVPMPPSNVRVTAGP